MSSTSQGVTTAYAYDAAARPLTQTTGTTVTTYAYNDANRSHTVTKGGRATVTVRDVAGRTSSVTDAAGRSTATSYARAAGIFIVTSTVNPGGLALATIATFDSRGMPRSTTDRSVWKTFMPEVSRGRGDGRLIRSRGRVGISARAPTG